MSTSILIIVALAVDVDPRRKVVPENRRGGSSLLLNMAPGHRVGKEKTIMDSAQQEENVALDFQALAWGLFYGPHGPRLKVPEVAPLMGLKAATLNGQVGDVLISRVVHDEHSDNTYMLRNAFAAEDLIPYMERASVLDNQKAVTVRGAFLQNPNYMGVFYREGRW